jgi:hypothetical protein
MKNTELSKLKQKFIKAYSDLPEKTREEVIVVVDGDPYTWRVAYKEIINNTELGNKILKNLRKIGIL